MASALRLVARIAPALRLLGPKNLVQPLCPPSGSPLPVSLSSTITTSIARAPLLVAESPYACALTRFSGSDIIAVAVRRYAVLVVNSRTLHHVPPNTVHTIRRRPEDFDLRLYARFLACPRALSNVPRAFRTDTTAETSASGRPEKPFGLRCCARFLTPLSWFIVLRFALHRTSMCRASKHTKFGAVF